MYSQCVFENAYYLFPAQDRKLFYFHLLYIVNATNS